MKRLKKIITSLKTFKLLRILLLVGFILVLELICLPIPGSILGKHILLILAVVTFIFSLYLISPNSLNNLSHLFTILFITLILMGISTAIILNNLPLYLVPIATGGILISLLIGNKLAFVTVTLLAFLLSIFFMNFEAAIFALLSGIVAALSTSKVKRLSEFYKPLLFVLIANVIATIGIELFKGETIIAALKTLQFAAMGGVGSTFLAFGLFPMLEKVSKITTSITLLELSNLDKPILREFSVKAPGSYNHSVIVANLAEAGARAIGANPLLARVGAYYHDVGKMKKPTYFIENQKGIKNPHEKLKPSMSVLIVASHVKDGVEFVKKDGLPREVIDIIREHHGTTLMESFYRKTNGADELDFRYPGPKPQTKESAIVMLADSVEAKARSLENPSPSRIKGLIKEITAKRVEDGQFSETDITMKELEKVGESFFPILLGAFHSRVLNEKGTYKESKKRDKNRGG